jgi:hypothetical protein
MEGDLSHAICRRRTKQKTSRTEEHMVAKRQTRSSIDRFMHSTL